MQAILLGDDSRSLTGINDETKRIDCRIKDGQEYAVSYRLEVHADGRYSLTATNGGGAWYGAVTIAAGRMTIGRSGRPEVVEGSAAV